ncbi:MAG: hypothetical protein LBT65_07805 [Synergistaceae bacterium]|jgi:hypothetical protein|nr:hypothetical protein [Synergistaceae bacterium]
MESFGSLIKAKYYYAVREYHAFLALLTGNRSREPVLFSRLEARALEAVCEYHMNAA